MNSWVKLVSISIGNMIIGAGFGSITAWCMSAGMGFDYQTAQIAGGSFLGAGAGLIFGSIAYYAIFKQRVAYETVCVVLFITAFATDLTAYLLQTWTHELGWLAIYIILPVFFTAAFKFRCH